MRRFFLAAVFVFSGMIAFSQTGESKKKEIVRMMELVGTKKLLGQMASSMKESYKKNYPNVEPGFWDEFFSEMAQGNGLVEMISNIYDKHFTEEDIKGIIAFYETPVGKKMIEKLPLITQESMEAGQVWGKDLGEKIAKRLKEKEKK